MVGAIWEILVVDWDMLLQETPAFPNAPTADIHIPPAANRPIDSTQDFNPAKDALGPGYTVGVRSKRQKASVSHVVRKCPSGVVLYRDQKKQCCATRLPYGVCSEQIHFVTSGPIGRACCALAVGACRATSGEHCTRACG